MDCYMLDVSARSGSSLGQDWWKQADVSWVFENDWFFLYCMIQQGVSYCRHATKLSVLTWPFAFKGDVTLGVLSMRSQVLYWAAQETERNC